MSPKPKPGRQIELKKLARCGRDDALPTARRIDERRYYYRLARAARDGDLGASRDLIHEFITAVRYETNLNPTLRHYFVQVLGRVLDGEDANKALNLARKPSDSLAREDKKRRWLVVYEIAKRRAIERPKDAVLEVFPKLDISDLNDALRSDIGDGLQGMSLAELRAFIEAFRVEHPKIKEKVDEASLNRLLGK